MYNYETSYQICLILYFIMKMQKQSSSAEDKELIKSQFHYSYKNQSIILDTQYNYQGNMLAVSNSHGQVMFYQAESDEENREVLFSLDKRKPNQKKNPAIIKMAWSLPSIELFATASISKQIDLYQCHKMNVEPYLCKKLDYIPIYICFCPIESQVILSVGLSDGSILFFNEKMIEIAKVQAHDEAVNCLSWEHKILTYQKNKWITNNFSHVKKFNTNEEFPLLISGSSDCYLKIWKYDKKSLTQIYKVKAHSKPIREVQWKPNYLIDSQRMIISCSEDGYVKLWRIKNQTVQTISLQSRCERNFGGPVYKAQFNFSGNLIAISYCNQTEERVETIIMRENNGTLGQEIKIQS